MGSGSCNGYGVCIGPFGPFAVGDGCCNDPSQDMTVGRGCTTRGSFQLGSLSCNAKSACNDNYSSNYTIGSTSCSADYACRENNSTFTIGSGSYNQVQLLQVQLWRDKILDCSASCNGVGACKGNAKNFNVSDASCSAQHACSNNTASSS